MIFDLGPGLALISSEFEPHGPGVEVDPAGTQVAFTEMRLASGT